MYAMLRIGSWMELDNNCERCNNDMAFTKYKVGRYWTCSSCYYTMTKDQRDDFASEVRDWDLVRKDRDNLD
jgi:transposase-like protein